MCIIDELISEGVISKECREKPFIRNLNNKIKMKRSEKLTQQEVEEIQYLYKSTYVTQGELAREYGVSRPTINKAIKRGISYV